MQIKIWGARGSSPVSGAQFNRYGGNTSCIDVRSDGGTRLVLDAGTGLGAMARAAAEPPAQPTVICLSHTHLDHIQGLPFYSPLYSGSTVIYGPPGTEEQISRLFDGAFHPVRRDCLENMEIREIRPGESFQIGDIRVETIATNHPGDAMAYKLRADGRTFVYGGDHEIPLGEDRAGEEITSALLRFMADSDAVLVDGHFSESDHLRCKGWGHSHPEQWAQALQKLNVGRIVLGHFNPAYDDEQMDALLQGVRSSYPDLKLDAAQEGCVI